MPFISLRLFFVGSANDSQRTSSPECRSEAMEERRTSPDRRRRARVRAVAENGGIDLAVRVSPSAGLSNSWFAILCSLKLDNVCQKAPYSTNCRSHIVQ